MNPVITKSKLPKLLSSVNTPWEFQNLLIVNSTCNSPVKLFGFFSLTIMFDWLNPSGKFVKKEFILLKINCSRAPDWLIKSLGKILSLPMYCGPVIIYLVGNCFFQPEIVVLNSFWVFVK